MIRARKWQYVSGNNKNLALGSQRKTVPKEVKIKLKSKNK